MIYAISAGDNGAVKFGVAGNPAARLSELQTGNPVRLKLIACADACHDLERAIHYHLRDYRLVGEWFCLVQPVLDMIEAIKAQAFSNEHIIMDHIYFADIAAINWYARRFGYRTEPYHLVNPDYQKRKPGYMRDYMAKRRQCITNSPQNSKH